MLWKYQSVEEIKKGISRHQENLRDNMEMLENELNGLAGQVQDTPMKKLKKRIKEAGEMTLTITNIQENIDFLNGLLEEKAVEAKAENNGMKIVDEFLADWKAKAVVFYQDLRVEYKKEISKVHPITKENLEAVMKRTFVGRGGYIRKYSDEKVAEILEAKKNGEWFGEDQVQIYVNSHFIDKWKATHTASSLDIVQRMNEAGYLDRVLDREVENKKISLISRIEKKAGNIIDASGLYLGNDGSINGWVEGDKNAKVYVQTIYAGGYNIQCLHYRVLVK